MNLALRDIRYNAARFLLTGLGIGLLVAASLVMLGIYRGIVEDALLLVEHIGADLWIVQAGTEGPFADTSTIAPSLTQRAETLPGVERVRGFLSLSRRITVMGGERSVTLIGLDYGDDDGGWMPLVAGRQLTAARGQVIADASSGLSIGDRLEIGRTALTVTGRTAGMTENNGDPMLAVSLNDLRDIRAYRSSEAVLLSRAGIGTGSTDNGNAGLAAAMISLRPGADPAVARAIAANWRDVSVLSSVDQRDLVINGRLERLRKQILIFTGLLTLITAVVVTLILYTMTLEKLHPIAMLKLIGARNRVIVAMIVEQAAALAVIGFSLGLVITEIVMPLFPRRVLVLPGDLAAFAAIMLATCLIGSLAGIRRAMMVRAQEVLS